MDALFNIIGITGTGCILLAYFLLQKGRAAGDSYMYLLLNLSGAALITVSLFWHWNLPAFVLEMAWIIITAYGLFKRRQKDKVLAP